MKSSLFWPRSRADLHIQNVRCQCTRNSFIVYSTRFVIVVVTAVMVVVVVPNSNVTTTPPLSKNQSISHTTTIIHTPFVFRTRKPHAFNKPLTLSTPFTRFTFPFVVIPFFLQKNVYKKCDRHFFDRKSVRFKTKK